MDVWETGEQVVEEFKNFFGVLAIDLEGAVDCPECVVLDFEVKCVKVLQKFVQPSIHF
jgi:hypothetical protein